MALLANYLMSLLRHSYIPFLVLVCYTRAELIKIRSYLINYKYITRHSHVGDSSDHAGVISQEYIRKTVNIAQCTSVIYFFFFIVILSILSTNLTILSDYWDYLYKISRDYFRKL